MLRNKDIVKRDGGGWHINGVADQTFPSRSAARDYIRSINLANSINKAADAIATTKAALAEPETLPGFVDADPFVADQAIN